MKKTKDLRTITWGHPNSESNPLSDTTIAKKLAESLKVQNHFFPIKEVELYFEEIFERYLIAGKAESTVLLDISMGLKLEGYRI